MDRIKALTLLVFLLVSSVTLQAHPVSAAVNISPTNGIVGSTATVSDLTAGQSYAVLWDGVTIISGSAVPTGGTITFTVPEDNGGAHNIVVQSPTGVQVFTTSFTILPSISISPSSGNAGTSITVTGRGFTASESSVKVYYGSDTVKSGIAADSNGSWSSSFEAPESASGNHDIDASGSNTLASAVTNVQFKIEPSISASPTSGGVGSSVTVKGTGFAASETGIKVVFGSTDIKTGITAGSNGSWTTTFDVPSTNSGSYKIDAYGNTTDINNVADLSFSVVSGISIDKTSVYVGDVITVTGTGFAANESGIYVTFDGVNQGNPVNANSSGQWTTTLAIPASTNGNHVIDAHGSTTSAGSIADKTLTVAAKIVLSPTSGNVGDQIHIDGTGFKGGASVNVKFGTATALGNISTDASGSFSGSFAAPKGISGNVDVVATDASNVTATTVFEMDKTPPGTPLVASPASGDTVGFIGDTRVTFEWKAVSDPSGVYYDIQVATDPDFLGIVFEHTGLSSAEYKSTEQEALSNGEYYWRVRAVDGATNASNWSGATKFKAGLLSMTALIIIAVVIVILILIIVRIKVAFFNKR